MKKDSFLTLFENTLSPPPETPLCGRELCSDLEGWDSMGVLSFIAMVNREYGLTLEVEKIYACKSVDELAALVADQLGS